MGIPDKERKRKEIERRADGTGGYSEWRQT